MGRSHDCSAPVELVGRSLGQCAAVNTKNESRVMHGLFDEHIWLTALPGHLDLPIPQASDAAEAPTR
jgi:hypothetical protein